MIAVDGQIPIQSDAADNVWVGKESDWRSVSIEFATEHSKSPLELKQPDSLETTLVLFVIWLTPTLSVA